MTTEAVNEIKGKLNDAIRQAEPDLEVHMEEVTEGLNSLAVQASAIPYDQHNKSSGDSNLQVSERQRRAIEEDQLALEAEKTAIKQSQHACEAARKWLAEATSQLDFGSVQVTFSGANNSGFQVGQNTGFISNLKWGAQP